MRLHEIHITFMTANQLPALFEGSLMLWFCSCYLMLWFCSCYQNFFSFICKKDVISAAFCFQLGYFLIPEAGNYLSEYLEIFYFFPIHHTEYLDQN